MQRHMSWLIVVDKLFVYLLIFEIPSEDLRSSLFTVKISTQDLLVKMLHVVI